MILIVTRHDVRHEYHHLPENEVQFAHLHATEKDADTMRTMVEGFCDAVFYMSQDGSIRVLFSAFTEASYPDLASAIMDVPCLHDLRF